jgi:CRISPR-associated endonuclease/helicase Cas3
MSLSVLPIQPDGRLLDGQVLSAFNERDLPETLNLHTAPVPASWEKRLKGYQHNEDGVVLLEMTADVNSSWSAIGGKFLYSEDFGLERVNNEPA